MIIWGNFTGRLKTGRITHDQAVRLLDNFFTIIETQCGRDTRVIIGGMGREHEKSADEFAMLVMDVLEVRRNILSADQPALL